jgi:hypothetical protein
MHKPFTSTKIAKLLGSKFFQPAVNAIRQRINNVPFIRMEDEITYELRVELTRIVNLGAHNEELSKSYFEDLKEWLERNGLASSAKLVGQKRYHQKNEWQIEASAKTLWPHSTQQASTGDIIIILEWPAIEIFNQRVKIGEHPWQYYKQGALVEAKRAIPEARFEETQVRRLENEEKRKYIAVMRYKQAQSAPYEMGDVLWVPAAVNQFTVLKRWIGGHATIKGKPICEITEAIEQGAVGTDVLTTIREWENPTTHSTPLFQICVQWPNFEDDLRAINIVHQTQIQTVQCSDGS